MKQSLLGFLLLLLTLSVFSQSRIVSGTVSDAPGKAVAAVSIKARLSGAGTVSNDNGRFSLAVLEGDSLDITSAGYAKMVVPVGSGSSLNVSLLTDAKNLETVVVTALGITRKSRSLTYSTQSVGNEELSTVKNTNVLNSLNGKVAGVQVNRTSGGPGGSVRVTLRGDKSTRNSQPLYVIDGMPIVNQIGGPDAGLYNGAPDGGDILSTLNPDDIESMNVLKGASASALYGSQGSNGVILITTKKGKNGTARLDFSSSVTMDKVSVLPELQYEYAQTTPGTATSPGSEDSWGAKGAVNNSGDYVKDFFQTGITFINSLALTTGNDRSTNYLSYSNTDNKGILPGSTLKQHTLTFRQTTRLLQDKLILDGTFTGSIQKAHNRMTPGIYFNPLTGLYLIPRGQEFSNFRDNYEYFSPSRYLNAQNWWNINYDKDLANGGGWGGQDYQQNPYWVMNRNTVDTRNQNVFAALSAKYLLSSWLSVQVRGNITNFIAEYQRDVYASTQGTLARFNGNYNSTRTNTTNLYGDLLLLGDKQLSQDWGLNFTLGGSVQDQKGKMLIVNGSPTVPNVFLESALDKATIDVRNYDNGNPAQRRVNSVFGSLQLNWRNKLFVDFSDRNDWSSTLALTPSETKGYNYYSVGVSAVLSDLFTLPAVINFAKLRASYAVVGNDIGAFSTLPLYTFNQGGISNPPASQPISTATDIDLKPERSKSGEIGLQLGFMQNRLTADLTWYKSNTYNQYYSGLNLQTATTKSDINTGNIQNTGIEASVSYKVLQSKKLSWTTTVNFSKNKNNIVQLFDPSVVPGADKNSTYYLGSSGNYTALRQGVPFGSLFGRTFQLDQQGRMIVDPTNHYLPVFVDSFFANPNPKFLLGWNNSFSFGRFGASFLIDGKFGGNVLSITQGYLDQFGVSQRTADARNNGGKVKIENAVDNAGHAWSGEIDAATYYRHIGGKTPAGAAYSYSATVVRMREISISYQIPVEGKVIKSLRVAAIGNNLFFFKKDAPFDPEQVAGVNAGGVGIDAFGFPAYRSYGLSLKCSF